MNLISISQRYIMRIKLYLSFKKAYRGSFVMTTAWKTHTGLTALLCTGVALMIIVAAALIKTMFFDTQTHTMAVVSKNVQPPPVLTSVPPVEQRVPQHLIYEKNRATLFQLDKPPVLEAPPAEPHTETEKPGRTAKVAVHHTRHWQLHIHRSSLSPTQMEGAIANAHKQLQSGYVSLARQGFLMLLTQDAHSVEAMEGMLLVSRQLGDSQSEEEYLEKLRQEIPGYEGGNMLGNAVSPGQEQG